MILKTYPGTPELELAADSGEVIKVILKATEFGIPVGVEIEVCAPLKALFFTFPKGRLYTASDGRLVLLCGESSMLAEEIVIGRELKEMLQGKRLNLKKVYMEGDDD